MCDEKSFPCDEQPKKMQSSALTHGLESSPKMAGADMPEPVDRDLSRFIDFDVMDRQGSRLGTLNCIWTDDRGEPAFVGIKTGWIFGKTHVVPAYAVEINENGRKLRLPYSEEQVKNAPAYDADAEMNREMDQEVRGYYGVEPGRTGQQQAETTPRARAERTPSATPEQATIQLSEEQLKIGKREVEVGGVRLRKVVRTEVVNQPVELRREEIVIERVPAEDAHSGRQRAFNEQEIYIPLRREEVVVEKETRLREEVRARKTTQADRREVSEQVRREDVEIEETGEARRNTRRPGGQKEDEPRSFRRHKS